MITDAIETKVQEKRNPKLCAIHPDKPFNLFTKAYMTKKHAPLVKDVNIWLEEALRKGDVQKIFDAALETPLIFWGQLWGHLQK
jgi:cyclohexadienyl dehydratase